MVSSVEGQGNPSGTMMRHAWAGDPQDVSASVERTWEVLHDTSCKCSLKDSLSAVAHPMIPIGVFHRRSASMYLIAFVFTLLVTALKRFKAL